MTTRALYHLNNSSVDTSGNGFDLLNIGLGPSYVGGKFSQGITNCNANDYSKITSASIFNMGSGVFTLEFFAKFVSSVKPTQALLQYANPTGATDIDLMINFTNNTGLWIYGLQGVIDDSTINIASLVGDGLFHHLALVRTSSTEFKFYLDGVLTRTYVVAGQSMRNSLNLTVGNNRNPIAFGDQGIDGTVLDEMRISDTVIYSANFTPPSSPFTDTSAPTIRAIKTVGDKWIISLFAPPTNGGGVVAPIGTFAQVNNSGVGEVWFKYGSLASNWTKIQSGTPQDGWNVSYTLSGLDEVTADAYFGSSSTAFDGKIIFARHGVAMMEFTTTNEIVLGKNSFVDFGAGKRVKINDSSIRFIQDSGAYEHFINIAGNEFQFDATGNLIVMRALAIHERLDSANSFKNRFYNNHNANVYEQLAHTDNITLSNVVSNLTFNRVYGDYSNNDIVHGVMTFVVRGTVDGNMGSTIIKKDYHVMNKQIIFDQDSFISQDVNADVAEIIITGFSYASQTFTLNVKTKKNTKQMLNSYIKVSIEEKVMSF
jgi:hypothetical protein